MALDWTRIAKRLMRRGLTENQAWSAISQTYISYVTSPPEIRSENELAELMYQKCIGWHFSWLTQPCMIEKAVATKDNLMQTIAARGNDEYAACTEDEMYAIYTDRREEESDTDYIADLLKLVPQTMRIPTLIVIQSILKRPPTKPLTVESCRKLLQKANVCNTSEYARQVYTFLTTLKR